MKITEYPKTTSIAKDDVLVTDGPRGTKTIYGEDAPFAMFNSVKEMHGNIIRGKNLGGIFTPEQATAISNGSFDNLWLGDYWTLGSNRFRIVDFNYYNSGAYTATPNHIVVMPDLPITNAALGGSLVSGRMRGFYATAVRSNLNSTYTNTARSLFSSSLRTRKEFVSNEFMDIYNDDKIGANHGVALGDYYAMLPSEAALTGHLPRTASPMGYNGNCSTQWRQLRLFAMGWGLGQANFWLEGQVWHRTFACYNAGTGYIGDFDYTVVSGIRPLYVVG